MVPDGGNGGPGPDPLVGGGFGIEIVDGAAGGIPSVEGVLRRAVAAFCHRLIASWAARLAESATGSLN